MTDTATFQITGWNETVLQDMANGAKLSHAKVTLQYTGAIIGDSTVDLVMAYSVDGTARFAGMERVTGTVHGRTGSFVLQHDGSFAAGRARSSFQVVVGAGTGDLAALRGGGSYEAGHGEAAMVSFELTAV